MALASLRPSRPSLTLLPALLLCLSTAAGCGGSEESTDEVSGAGNASGSPAGGGGGGSGGKGGAGQGGPGGGGSSQGGAGGSSGNSGSGGASGLGGSSGQAGAGGSSGKAGGGAGGSGGAGGASGGAGGASGGAGGAGGSSQGGAGGSSGSSGSGGEAGGSGASGGQAGASGEGGASGGAGQAGTSGEGGQAGAGGCGSGMTICDGSCVSLLNDPMNCGSCFALCQPFQTCSFGSCLGPCDAPGTSFCGGSCVDVQVDPANCGACGVACDPGWLCSQGQCTTDCGGPPHVLCGKQCTDPLSDPSHCGDCSTACAAGELCVQGLCVKPGCSSDADCQDPQKPACDVATGKCEVCVADATAPVPEVCKGVCSLVAPSCVDHQWACTGPGYEPVEQSCDGFDNDCDGQVDEGVCQTCTVPIDKIQQNLQAIWDIDFDFTCTTYLTTLISGPDYTREISPDPAQAPRTYYGNLNQNMGFALVDPDPNNRRVVVSYSCANASCQAQNGLTLLYTCSAQDPGCGCAGQANCPGFLNTPFLPTGLAKAALTFNGFEVGTPTGLAAGAGNRYFVGNFKPLSCDSSPSCVPCDPAHPGVTCSPSKKACCDSSPFGRLAEFTLPSPGVEPTFRVDRVLDGEQIFGLASARNGSVWVGTYVSPTKGNLYRYDPIYDVLTLVQTFNGPIFSLSQSRKNGDWYVEVRGTPKLVRLDEQGSPLPLPATVPANPANEGVLQVGPDFKLYRLVGKIDMPSPLSVYDIP